MHINKVIAIIDTNGQAQVISEQFLPYDLYLKETKDIDSRLDNLNAFYHWCASRMISFDRKYAKEMLNSIGAPLAITDKNRAFI